MPMPPWLKKLALTAHVTVSVGWLGAAGAVLALAVAGLLSDEARVMSAACLGTELIWRFVIVPLSLAALATGLLQALTTPWGLFQHFWVITKLALTSGAVMLLLLHTSSLLPALVAAADDPASAGHATGGSHGGMPPQVHLVVAAALALLLLLATTTLSMFKPWGQIGRGTR